MKIENGSIFDQTVQKEKPFEKTSAGVSFDKTAKAKLMRQILRNASVRRDMKKKT